MLESIIRPNPNAVPDAAVELIPDSAFALLRDGTGRLLDPAGRFTALSASATRMLREALITNADSAARLVAATFRADPDRIREDLNTFLDDLRRGGLVRLAVAEAAVPPPHVRWLKHALALVDRSARSPRGRSRALLILAWVAIRRLGWARTTAVWQAFLRERYPPVEVPPQGIDPAATVRSAAAGCILPITCKEKALACWMVLRRAGLPARVVVGVDFFPFASHAWCESNGVPQADFADRCVGYEPVFVYD